MAIMRATIRMLAEEMAIADNPKGQYGLEIWRNGDDYGVPARAVEAHLLYLLDLGPKPEEP
jgi:hypothetical protein